MNIRLTVRQLQYLAAFVVIVVAVFLAVTDAWVFSSQPVPLGKDPSVWQIILSDSTTLGFLKLGLIAVGMYAFASVAALIVGGRWIREFPGGVSVDELVGAAEESEEVLQELRNQIQTLTQQRDQALELNKQLMDVIKGV